ncbi:hypothetical protein EDC01DRAFT_615955 [Geopyxis carbonaria]|nr:hypothetical protein EDC01DRAFT_615955 [Geopyxis carbonaria]
MLNTLPTELINSVLEICNLTRNEKLHLRLVCRTFCILLSPSAFRNARLSEFTRDGFDSIMNLSQSSVAKYVIHFEYKLTEYVHLKDVHSVDPSIQLEDYASGHTVCDQSVKKIAECIVTHHQIYMEQSDILGTFYDVICLSQALPAFRSLKAVTISRFVSTSDAPLRFEACSDRAFWSVIKALQRCEMPIEHFSIDSLYPTTLLSVPKPKREQIWEVMCNLKSLCVKLCTVIQSGEESVDDWRKAFQNDVISKAKHLEVLRISYAEAQENTGTRRWVLEQVTGSGWLSLPYLRVLEMHSPDKTILFQDILLSFLQDHRQTLQELSISGFTLFNVNRMGIPLSASWTQLFEQLKNVLKLRRVEFDRLEYLDSSQSNIQEVDRNLLDRYMKLLLSS